MTDEEYLSHWSTRMAMSGRKNGAFTLDETARVLVSFMNDRIDAVDTARAEGHAAGFAAGIEAAAALCERLSRDDCSTAYAAERIRALGVKR